MCQSGCVKYDSSLEQDVNLIAEAILKQNEARYGKIEVKFSGEYADIFVTHRKRINLKG